MIEQNKWMDFKIGNWVEYIPEKKYCTISSLGIFFIIKDFRGDTRQIFELTEIGRVSLTRDNISLFGFQLDTNGFLKIVSSDAALYLKLAPKGKYSLLKNNTFLAEISYVHQLQNAIFSITGLKVQPGLYGN